MDVGYLYFSVFSVSLIYPLPSTFLGFIQLLLLCLKLDAYSSLVFSHSFPV